MAARRSGWPKPDDGEDARKPPRPQPRGRGWWLRRWLGVSATLTCLYGALLWCRERNILLRRPPRLWQPRPLLVVGMMASGTQQMAKELNRLGLRVGHESSGAEGGTVSWLHGLRLLDDPAGPDVGWLCARPDGGSWHPMMLEPGTCPTDGRLGGWGPCWRQACAGVVRRQYGCHLRAGRPCLPAYGKVLLQVRHPLRTIASCARGFCAGGDARSDASGARLLGTVRALLPSLPWAEVASCGGQFALLWAAYHAERLRGGADAWYRVEDTPPCAVLRLAGLLDEGSGAREGPALRAACALEAAAVGSGAAEHGSFGRHNTDGLRLSYADLEALAGARVRAEVERLARALGYDGDDGAAVEQGVRAEGASTPDNEAIDYGLV